jgi:hypothetical protein
MAQLTTDKITGIYCIADDFCKEFSKEVQKHQILLDDGKRHRETDLFQAMHGYHLY